MSAVNLNKQMWFHTCDNGKPEGVVCGEEKLYLGLTFYVVP